MLAWGVHFRGREGEEVMKKRLLPLMLLAGGSLFAAPHVSIGIGIGAPAYYPPAPVVVNARPPCPGPGYSWVDGYWANGGWIAGYWAPPVNAYYAAPGYYLHGRDWDRDEHRWRDRDGDHDRRRDHDRGRQYGNGFRR
jgi:hypothetical protein